MKRYLKVYLTLVKLNYSNQLAFRADFVNSLIGNAAWSIFQITSTLLLTSRTPRVFGWTREEFLLLAAIYNVVLSVFYTHFSRNFNELPDNIHYGRLDSFLVKPIDSQFLLSCWHMGFGNILRFIIGIGFIGYLAMQINLDLTFWSILGFFALLAFSVLIVYSVWFIVMTITVWLSRLSNLVDVLYGINWVMRYPQEMFKGLGIYMFFIIFPLTFVVVSPAKVLLQKILLGDVLWPIVLSVGLFLVSRMFWKFALRYYTSASS